MKRGKEASTSYARNRQELTAERDYVVDVILERRILRLLSSMQLSLYHRDSSVGRFLCLLVIDFIFTRIPRAKMRSVAFEKCDVYAT